MVKVSFYSYVFSIIFLLTLSAQATLKKSRKLTPYQVQIENCFAGRIPASKISDSKSLYGEISKQFPLQASETNFREVIFIQNGEKKKLRYEEDIAQIYRIEADEKLTELSKDNMSESNKNNGMRYKINSRESKLNQLLNGAQIQSDFIKTTEYRSKQIVLNLVWSDTKIKNLSVQFTGLTKNLECQLKETTDICNCR